MWDFWLAICVLQVSPLQRLVNLLRRVTCQRRKPERYEAMLALGRQVPERKQEEWYDRLAWWSEVKTKQGSKVFVLAPRGPQGETEPPADLGKRKAAQDYYINMKELLGFALAKMHKEHLEARGSRVAAGGG